MDVFLFLHLVPMIAAVGLRPHRKEAGRNSVSARWTFSMLVVWWVFLYAFVVFPSQYVSLNVVEYDRNFGPLYLVRKRRARVSAGVRRTWSPCRVENGLPEPDGG